MESPWKRFFRVKGYLSLMIAVDIETLARLRHVTLYVPCLSCCLHTVYIDLRVLPTQVEALGDGFQVWKEAAGTLNKKSRKADKGWFFNLRAGRGAKKLLTIGI
jgi:hypothetical protein